MGSWNKRRWADASPSGMYSYVRRNLDGGVEYSGAETEYALKGFTNAEDERANEAVANTKLNLHIMQTSNQP